MPLPAQLPKVIVLIACSAGLAAPVPAAEEQLTLCLASGRTFAGTIDPASNEEEIVLRTDRSGTTVRRPIRWERIVGVTADGKPLDVVAVKEMARQAAARSRESGIGGRDSGVGKTKVRESVQRESAAKLPREVASISFDAGVANWDADVETDGLVIDLRPTDANGFVVPVEGTVQIELFAPQGRAFQHAPHSGGDTLELVERWTRPLSESNFGAAGGRLRLPFGAVHPEIDVEWLASWYGLVHVRIAIPGQGVFEDSRDAVRMRPWAPNRDSLEMNTGRRFVPTEGVGRRD